MGVQNFKTHLRRRVSEEVLSYSSCPPHSLKLNGHLERAQRTHTEEFYEVTDVSFEILELNRALLKWEKVYNTIRPHQAVGHLTSQQFKERRWGVTNHMNVYN
ncbi:MAG: transposase [Dehalococcoidia bacterium]|nr:transposase [Dehalococcoidia bacterium]